MSDIPESVKKLSDVDLRAELVKVGVNVGPITPTTRRLFQSKLANKLGIFNIFKNFGKSKPKEEISEKPATKSESQLFYGVFIPNTGDNSPTEPIVFDSKSSTILSMKENKDARFKVFTTYEAAKVYSMEGTSEDAKRSSTSSVFEKENEEDKFKTPKQEYLNKFMHMVEKGEIDDIRRLIWENPKYLISSADGPVVLKASARYNALHVAARSNQPAACVEILSTLENPDFHLLLYPTVVDPAVTEQRTEHILDLYLNTPEKGMYETPLHIASKLGFRDVVSELVSYTQCSTMSRNKFGDTPHDVVCSRASANLKGLKDEIERLLGDQYFVPLLRYHDNSEHAVIGTPMNVKDIPDDYAEVSPVPTPHILSPVGQGYPPTRNISALAGPMSKEQAVQFQKIWKTPSRQDSLGSLTHLRRIDSEKGDEHIGRRLALTERVGWVEFWDFLSDFANFGTEEGLLQLEEFLAKRNSTSTANNDDTPGEIVEITDMFQNIHLNDRETNIAHTQEKDKCTASLHENRQRPYMDQVEPLKIIGGTDYNTKHSDSVSPEKFQVENLVKRLFDDEKPDSAPSTRTISVEEFTDDFSKSLTIDKQVKIPGNDVFVENWFKKPKEYEYRSPAKQYRCPAASLKSSTSDVFSSPTLSASGESILDCTDPPKVHTFLSGEAPTKLDQDVLMAIGERNIDAQKYPILCRWRDAVLSFSEKERQKWGTPRKNGKVEKLTPPTRSYSVSGFFSTPTSTPNRGLPNNFSTPSRNMRRYLCRSLTLSTNE